MSSEKSKREESVIVAAERARASGNHKASLETLQQYPFRFSKRRVSKKEAFNDLRAARIGFHNEIGLVHLTESGTHAKTHLLSAKDYIERFHLTPKYREHLPKMTEDPSGAPYDMTSELLMDQGIYWKEIYFHHQEPRALSFAKLLYQCAFHESPYRDVRGISLIRQGQLPGDTVKKDGYELIKEGYEEAFPEALFKGNTDRTQWLAKTLFLEAHKRHDGETEDKAYSHWSIVLKRAVTEKQIKKAIFQDKEEGIRLKKRQGSFPKTTFDELWPQTEKERSRRAYLRKQAASLQSA